MDIVVKMDRFQILQNALKLKYTLRLSTIGPHIFDKQKGSEELTNSTVYIKYWAPYFKWFCYLNITRAVPEMILVITSQFINCNFWYRSCNFEVTKFFDGIKLFLKYVTNMKWNLLK